METLVLPAQDQLSQHQYWQKQRVFSSPCSRPRKPDSLLPPSNPLPSSAPSSPLYRSAREFASPAPLARSLSGVPENAPKGRASQENGPKIARGNRNPKPANPRSKTATPRLPESRPRPGFGKKFDPRRKEEVGSSPPKITILPRPQSKEAAMLDLAKITGLPLSEVYAKNGLTLDEKPKAEPKKEPGVVRFKEDPRKGQLRKASNNNRFVKEEQLPKPEQGRKGEQVKKVVKVEGSNVELLKKLAGGLHEGIANVEQSKKVASNVVEELKKVAGNEPNVVRKVETNVVAKGRAKVSNTTTSVDIVDEVAKTPGAPSSSVKEQQQMMMFSRNFEGFLFEKWAGPGFTNSPPPSSLPIPNFSSLKKHQQQQRQQAPVQAELQQMIDNEAATKGLRRILNLDF